MPCSSGRKILRNLWQSLIPRLKEVLFHERLGSVLDKVERLRALAVYIGREYQTEQSQKNWTRRLICVKPTCLVIWYMNSLNCRELWAVIMP